LTSAAEDNCYIAIFAGEACASDGGVYLLSKTWYTAHSGGTFRDLGSCGKVVENWFSKSGSHRQFAAALASNSNLHDKATYMGTFDCASNVVKLDSGAGGCPEGQEITTPEGCQQAVDQLGLARMEMVLVDGDQGMPKWCSVSTGSGPRAYFGSSNAGVFGRSQRQVSLWQLAPVCLDSPDVRVSRGHRLSALAIVWWLAFTMLVIKARVQ